MSNIMDSRKANIAPAVKEEEAEEAVHTPPPGSVPVDVQNVVLVKSQKWADPGYDIYASYTTYVLPPSVGGIPSVVQILPQDELRIQAAVRVTGANIVLCKDQSAAQAKGNLQAATSPLTGGNVSTTNTGTGFTLANFGAIATAAAGPAGIYTINWSYVLAGTATAADDNCCSLRVAGTVVQQGISGNVVGTVYQQAPYTTTLLAGGQAEIMGNTSGSGTATVSGEVSVTSLASSTISYPPTPQGYLFSPGANPPALENNETLWATNCDPVLTAYISVIIERGGA